MSSQVSSSIAVLVQLYDMFLGVGCLGCMVYWLENCCQINIEYKGFYHWLNQLQLFKWL